MPRVRVGRPARTADSCGRSVLVPAGSARRAQTALRVEQEHAGRDDLFAFSQALANLDAIGELRADRDGAAARTVAHGHEHVLLQPGVDDGVARDRDDVLSGRLEHRGAVEARV